MNRIEDRAKRNSKFIMAIIVVFHLIFVNFFTIAC